MTLNEGNYRCNVINSAGRDEMIFGVHVISYFDNNNNNHQVFDKTLSSPVVSSSSSADSQMSYSKNIITNNANESKRQLSNCHG